MCTGLFECSFALPVSLFASLPAFGWLRLLQGTLLVVVVVVVDGDVAVVLPEVVLLVDCEDWYCAEPLVAPDDVVLPVVLDMPVEPVALDAPFAFMPAPLRCVAVAPLVPCFAVPLLLLLLVCAYAGTSAPTTATASARLMKVAFMSSPPGGYWVVVEDGFLVSVLCVLSAEVPVLPVPCWLDEGPVALLVPLVPVVDCWPLEAPWSILAVEFTSVDVWFAEVELEVLLVPLPMFTPGLTFTPALMSEFWTPTLASTPTFGLML